MWASGNYRSSHTHTPGTLAYCDHEESKVGSCVRVCVCVCWFNLMEPTQHTSAPNSDYIIITNRKRKSKKHNTRRKVHMLCAMCSWNSIERWRTTIRPASEKRRKSVSRAFVRLHGSQSIGTSAAAPAAATHNIIFLEPKSVESAISLASSICYLVAVASNFRCEQTGCHRKIKKKKVTRDGIALACVSQNWNEDICF